MNAAIRASIPLLTSCLNKVYPASTLDTLQVVLMSTLSAHLAPSWQPERPTRGSSIRSLLVSPLIPAPTPIRAAADATGVRWRDWVLLLTRGDACEIFIDPGVVSYRVGSEASVTIYWQSKSRTVSVSKKLPWDVATSPSIPEPKVYVEEEPTWMTNLLSRFPETPKPNEYASNVSLTPIRRPSPPASVSDRSVSPISAPASGRYIPPHRLTTSFHTRTPSEVSSAVSSSGSSIYSALSLSMSQLSVSSGSTAPSSAVPSTRSSSPIDDECALSADIEYESDDEDAVVYIDSSRNEVTEYECGKVGVLGGAVMLGMPKGAAAVSVRANRFQRAY